MPPGAYRPVDVLWLVQGVPGGRQTAFGGRYSSGSDHRRGKGPAPGDHRVEGGGGRAGAGNPSAQKKHDRGWGRRRMRCPASEKTEIIRIVEQSHLSARKTLEQIGVPRGPFC